MSFPPTLGKPPPLKSQLEGMREVFIGVLTLIVAYTTAVCWWGAGSRCSGQEAASKEGERDGQGHLPSGAFIHPPFIHSSLRVSDVQGTPGTEDNKAWLLPQRGLETCT